MREDLYGGVPGFGTARETYENHFRFGQSGLGLIIGVQISGAARDAGATPTTLLRSGLLLGKITSSGLWTNWSATATDGSQLVDAILLHSFKAQDLDANNRNLFVWALAAGPVQASKIVNLNAVARAQMRGRFIFDDDLPNKYPQAYLAELAKTANYTVVAADAGTLFTTAGASGAVTFTLPALAAGLGPFEFLNVVDQNMTVASAAGDDIIWDNDAQVDSLAFSTAAHKIGGRLRFTASAAGDRWYVQNLSPATCTVTAAT